MKNSAMGLPANVVSRVSFVVLPASSTSSAQKSLLWYESR